MSYKILREVMAVFFALVLSLSASTSAQAAPPANDNFANAIVITSLPFSTTVDATEATTEPGEPQFCSFPEHTIWYSFTPAEDMVIQASMESSQGGGSLGIFKAAGPAISDLTLLGCLNPTFPINWQVEAGQTYYLRVDSFSWQPGLLQINLDQILPPANDNFASAESISLPFNASVDNTNATTEPGESQVCTPPYQSLWYSITPFEDMVIKVNSTGSPVGGTVSVFLASGTGISDLVSIGCAGINLSTNFQLDAGQTYYLRFDSAFGQPGVFQMSVEQIISPANDRFANADAILSLPFSGTVDNTNATPELGEPTSCNFPFRSLWYSFTPVEDMAIKMDNAGNEVGGTIGLFLASGPTLSDLTIVGCAYNGTPVNLQLDGGQTYFLLVDSFGQPGLLHLNMEPIISPANDRFTNAEVITSLPFNSSVDNTTASAEIGEPQQCTSPFRSVWYSFTPEEDVTLQASSPSGSVVSVFLDSGSGVSDLQLLTCAISGNTSNFQVKMGQTYYLRVDSTGGPSVLQLSLVQITSPPNDDFANAEVILSLPFNVSVDNSTATFEPNELVGCSFPSRSLWYSFTPAESLAVRVHMLAGGPVGGAVDVFLASGSGFTDLSFLGCATNASSTNFRFEAGKTYYLRANSFGEAGILEFDMLQIFPPANDDFADAEAIGTLPFSSSVDNTNATSELGEPQGCGSSGKSVWYSFVPPEDMLVRFSTSAGLDSGNVSVFRVAGTEFTDLTFLTCAGNVSSHFQAERGEIYYLRLDSFGQAGFLQINLAEMNPPANDNFANAELISTMPFSTTVDITDATAESFEPQNCYFLPNTVWYAFTPTETMLLRADTLGSSFSSGLINIYRSTGTGITNLHFLGCSGLGHYPSFLAETGQTYYLQVGSTSTELGTLQVNLVPPAPPENDDLANTMQITSLPFSATTNIIDATNEAGEPQNCYNMSHTIWYSFTPTETIKVRVDTTGSEINANINTYRATGNGFQDLQFIDCSGFSGGTTFIALSGETYIFQVDGIGTTGLVLFNLNAVPVISGRVTEEVTGTPLSGDVEPYSQLTLYKSCGEDCVEFVNSQQADSEGRFFFDSYYYGVPLGQGEYWIDATAQLYLSHRFGPFTFSGYNLYVGDLPLSPTAVIRGRAVDSKTGTPLSDAYVVLFRCDGDTCSEHVNSQYTDSEGHFQFNSFYYSDPLPAGNYRLEFSATLYESRIVETTISEGENRDLGDVLVDPLRLIGSISGRLIDDATGKPVSPSFSPGLNLYRCEEDSCFFTNAMAPDSEGRFRFETDTFGNPLIVGSYLIVAFADQYQTLELDIFDVGENMHRTVGDIKLISFPVRFSEMQMCNSIPASGGECAFSIRITNGTNKDLAGKTWSMVNGYLPNSFGAYTNFQIKESQDLALGKGRSKVFHFRFTVPANLGSYGSSLCIRLFVGEDPQAFLNTIGVRDNLFCFYRETSGFAVALPQTVTSAAQTNMNLAETGSEVEPNNSCQSAQDVGEISDLFVMNGELDSSQEPDVDFFRFTGTPGQPAGIDLEGEPTGKGTLEDPFLGFFDSNCSLIDLNDDSGSLNSHLDITVPEDGIFILAATTCCDNQFTGGGFGSYQLTAAPVQLIGSISGMVTDAQTGQALGGDAPPYTFVRLMRCNPFLECQEVNYQSAGSDGSFYFETDSNGSELLVGKYMVVASAHQYYESQTEIFAVGEDENYNVGNVALTSYPLRFSDIQSCSVSSDGGICDFSVKVTNGLSTKFSGKAWSVIDGYNIGSFTDYTSFQADALRDVTLEPGRSAVLRFRFMVRRSVADGAFICATAFAGQNPNPLFNTVGGGALFCITKGDNGFTLMSEQQMHAQLHRLQTEHKVKPSVPKLKN